MDDVLKIIESVSERIQSSQEGKNLLRKLQSGALTEAQAILSLRALPQAQAILSDLETLKGLVENGSLVTNPATGSVQMNPLLEAAIAERAFLDGDVPELRFGPIPEGGRPAVPVATESTNPILVGWMLEQATKIIEERFEEAQLQFQEERQRFLEDFQKAGDALGVGVTALVPVAEKSLAFPARPTGVAGYMAGRRPIPMVVAEPESLDMVPVDQKRLFAYRALTTTQGKESLVPGIAKGILQALQAQGVDVSLGNPSERTFTGHWGMNLYGADDLTHHFNFAELALKTISQELLKNPLTEGKWLLQVVPLNSVSQRYFGWQASLGRFHA